jgi:hypothetical protein
MHYTERYIIADIGRSAAVSARNTSTYTVSDTMEIMRGVFLERMCAIDACWPARHLTNSTRSERFHFVAGPFTGFKSKSTTASEN